MKISQKIKFPYITLLVAFLVSGSAAFYSVFGLAKLFSGAYVNVIIMAGSLEFSKLVITAYLHQYWNNLPNALKYYLVSAVIILAIITSGGIYGYLSNAYQVTASKDKYHTEKINLLAIKKSRFETNLGELKNEREQINLNIQSLSKSLGTDTQSQVVDRKTGQILTQIQSSSKKGVQNQLQVENNRRENLISKIDNLQDSIQTYEIKIIEANANNDAASELGPLKYLSGLTGWAMDKVVNVFILLLIFVFDPLAISLVVAALKAFEIESNKNINATEETQAGSELERNTPLPELEVLPETSSEGNLEVLDEKKDPDYTPTQFVDDENEIVLTSQPPENKKKRGRPAGSKNKEKSLTDGIKRTITETLTPDVAQKIAGNLPTSKKKV